MRRALKHFFIPHAENNYHPHILHTKRAVFYALVFCTLKVMVVLSAILIPSEAYLHPDVLGEQYKAIVALTNDMRTANNIPALTVAAKLNASAESKVEDMSAYQYFSHVGPYERDLHYFLDKVGYPYTVAGENLGLGFSDARSLVKAWENSPKHYANLVDPDFTEIGVGLQAGVYRGEPTVYAAQHFGARAVSALDVIPTERVLGSVTSKNPPGVDASQSWVYWLEKDGGTVLQARITALGEVRTASLQIGKDKIALERLAPTSSVFVGSISVPGTADQFFSPIILPVLTLVDSFGHETVLSVDWFNVKPASPPPVATQYSQAKTWFKPFGEMVSASQTIFLSFIILFAVALVLNITIEIRRQHHHITAQTVLLLTLITWLWWS